MVLQKLGTQKFKIDSNSLMEIIWRKHTTNSIVHHNFYYNIFPRLTTPHKHTQHTPPEINTTAETKQKPPHNLAKQVFLLEIVLGDP